MIKTLLLCLALSTACFAQSKTAGKAVVYFYSLGTTTTIGTIRKEVYFDDKVVAKIRPEHFFVALVDPGKHTFRFKNKKSGGVEMDFAADKTYYIRVEWATGGWVKPNGLTVVGAESGGYDVKQLQPVDEKDLIDKTRAFREVPK